MELVWCFDGTHHFLLIADINMEKIRKLEKQMENFLHKYGKPKGKCGFNNYSERMRKKMGTLTPQEIDFLLNGNIIDD